MIVIFSPRTMKETFKTSLTLRYQRCKHEFQEFDMIVIFQGVFFFLLGILGGVLAVVLGLVIVQQGKVCIDWVIRTRRTLSRPPSYNTVAKPPRYSICGQWSRNL